MKSNDLSTFRKKVNKHRTNCAREEEENKKQINLDFINQTDTQSVYVDAISYEYVRQFECTFYFY